MEGKGRSTGTKGSAVRGGTSGVGIPALATYTGPSLEYRIKPWMHHGAAGTKRSLKSYVSYLEDLVTEALGGGSHLSEKFKLSLRSYRVVNLDAIKSGIDLLPDDSAPTRRADGTAIVGSWSVLNAGVPTAKSWIDNLNSVEIGPARSNRGEHIAHVTAMIKEFTPTLEFFYNLSREAPAETPTVRKGDGGTITLYRRMWKGEADIILDSKKVEAGMSGSDSYKKYFTTDMGHTQTFRNVSSTDPDNEVILEFTLDWDDYWAFVKSYGTPNQQTGAMDVKESAIMNQERIVKGAGANFKIQAQIDKVLERREHHNIGIGVGNAAEFDKIVKGRIKLIK